MSFDNGKFSAEKACRSFYGACGGWHSHRVNEPHKLCTQSTRWAQSCIKNGSKSRTSVWISLNWKVSCYDDANTDIVLVYIIALSYRTMYQVRVLLRSVLRRWHTHFKAFVV